MKRSFSLRQRLLLATGLALIAATYGLVRLAYGLFLPDVQHDLGLPDAAAGRISSGASASYCVGAVVGFVLASRCPRALVTASALVAGFGALAMAAAQGPGVFGSASVIASAAAGLASPALVRIVAQHVPEQVLDRAQSVVNAGTGPGLVGAGVLALLLLPGWRAAWAWSGLFTLAVGAALLAVARGDGGGPSVRSPGPSRSWFRAHGSVVVLAVLFGAGTAVVWTYARALLVDAGAPPVVSVSAWIALGLGGAAVVLTAPWTSRIGPRRLWAITAGGGAVAVLTLGAAPRSTLLAMAACAVFGWAYTAATGALIAWTTAIDAERASAGTSVLFVALVLGQAAGAAAAGAFVQQVGYPLTFAAGALVVAVSTGAVLAARPVRAADAARSSGCTPPTPRSRRAARSRRPAGP
ncbi:MFS transporter [Curtobacterium sp. 22159]|uniref:MFS transporter n=1 Tax=Curtobacterium sp. 22159 TaxID=3453882 RepID=UPI003F853219